ncbi:MAG TPA: ATP-binding cassette domain-containing protein [Casimicrobiaceae bacterium]|nr:ATP-binding cassette domain-containing protein [Casimicrobiaceae bacterium]
MAAIDRVVAADAAPRTAAFRLRAVNKWYGHFHVLRDVDLHAASGERIVLWGPSGSGKTTLLRCLAGLEPVESGFVEISGSRKPVGPLSEPRPTRGVAMVFQKSTLFLHMRVIDNLTLGPRDVRRMSRRDAEAIAMRHLGTLRMTELAQHYPVQLSGGQQQRAEIARALCMDPSMVLFDEPTAALDPELRGDVAALIGEVADAGRTVVVATHDEQLVRGLAPRIVLMADGAIVGETNAAAHFGPIAS